jgi:hypothetical protein
MWILRSGNPWRCAAVAVALLVLGACATPLATQTAQIASHTVHSDDGLSELTAPGSWRTRPNLGRSGTIRLGDDSTETYLIVNTYLPNELQQMSFPEMAEHVSTTVMKRQRSGKISTPRSLTVNGRPAVEYEISGATGSLPLIYLSTVIDGERARYHIVSWTLAERFSASRDLMREVAASFRESAQKRVAKTRIDLVFDWPERLTSTATVRSKSNKRGEVSEMSLRAVSTVRPMGEDHLLISARVTERKFTPGGKDKGKADYLQRALKEALTDIPDYVVDRDGDFVRVENLAPYLKRIEDALVAGLPEAPKEVRAKAQQMVRSMLSEQILSATVQDEWNFIVGNWANGSYVPGEVYEVHSSYKAPALGGEVFPMVMTQQLAGREACRKGAAANSCVRLLQTSRVSDPSFGRATSALLKKTLGTNDVAIESAEVIKSVEVIADPKTLLPYRSVMKETKRFVVAVKGEAPVASEELTETVTTYSY